MHIVSVYVMSVYVESKHAIQKARGRPRTFTFTGGEAKAGATELLASQFVPVFSEEPVVEEQGLVSEMVQ